MKMESIAVYDSHITLAYWQHIGVILLCVLGIVFNMTMLMVFVAKKQVRGSVYTTYMIQIAITDLMVCVVWLIMSSMYIGDIPSLSADITVEADEEDEIKRLPRKSTTANYAFYRFTFSFYYLHYYFNIFLLATMSVERCVAVWRSLRCQRYQFNRKFIFVISVAMGLAAIACTLPSMIDPTLIIHNEWEAHSMASNATEDESSVQRKFVHYHRCFQPLRVALEHNHTFVTDYKDITVRDCVDFLTNETLPHLHYDDSMDASLFDGDGDVDKMEYFDETYDFDEPYDEEAIANYGEEEAYTILYDITWPEGSKNIVKAAHRALYHELLALAWKYFPFEVDMRELCHPMQSHRARVYTIVVNLVVGFFIPFAAIVFSYLYIAYMIGKRAKERLEADTSLSGDDTIGRRMSDFLKQFVNGGSSAKASGDRSPPYKCGSGSPILRLKQKHRKLDSQSMSLLPTDANCDNQHARAQKRSNHNNSGNQSSPRVDKTMESNGAPYSSLIAANHNYAASPAKGGAQRPRTPSCGKSAAHQRRISGGSAGSASSAESFQTDQTSIHTSSSPGVRLSAPNFVTQDKALVKRTGSADGSCSSTSTPTSLQHTGRWSGEVFRSASLDEHRQQTPDPKSATSHEDLDLTYDNHEVDSISSKRANGAPSRGKLPGHEDSTQDLTHGSHTRIYQSKNRNFTRQVSSTSSNYYRGRAYSSTSRVSNGGGASHKTIVHKNAERNMRVSRTVLAYVVVFSICWLPQRIYMTLYTTESLVGRNSMFCHSFSAWTRILSFFSVLLNPVMYAITQREVRVYLRKLARRVFKCGPPSSKTKRPGNAGAGNNVSENGDFSIIADHNLTSDDLLRRERHQRNRELWSRMVARLGRKSLRTSLTGSGITGGVHGEGGKQSDGTIDEEKSDENRQSSKGQSSSNSCKLTSNWEDWQKLIDMAAPKNEEQQKMSETIL